MLLDFFNLKNQIVKTCFLQYYDIITTCIFTKKLYNNEKY